MEQTEFGACGDMQEFCWRCNVWVQYAVCGSQIYYDGDGACVVNYYSSDWKQPKARNAEDQGDKFYAGNEEFDVETEN